MNSDSQRVRTLKGLPRRIYSRFKFFHFILEYPGGLSALFKKAVFVWRLGGWQNLWRKSVGYIQSKANQIDENSQAFYDLYFAPVLSSLPPAQKGVIFVSHDASATGAPITLLNQCKAYKQIYGNNLVIILISGGELLQQFEAIAPVINLHRDPKDIKINKNILDVFSKLSEGGYSRCIANTVVSGALQKALAENHIQIIYEIHELLQVIRSGGWNSYAENIAQSGSIVVFAAHYVADKFVEHFGLPIERVRILPQGASLIYSGSKQMARGQLLQRLGLPNEPKIKILLGAGFAHHRKGTDLFCEIAEEFYQKQRADVHLIWLGNRDEHFEHWKKKILPRLPYKKNVHFWDFDPQPEYIFAGADVFLLTSREDPFPSVALEALANNTPVITFKDTGGIEEILNGTNGIVVEHLNVQMMADAAWQILQNPDKMRPSETKLQTYPEFIRTLMALFPES